ncbi:MAG: tetratricopeptide repeat protein, partial [Bacteroidales bacterium]|nr:tetratricopeptide repeat protein [Bacteroidales bacterium]
MRIAVLAYIVFAILGANTMASQADSLLAVLKSSKEDSLKVQTYLSLAALYYRSDPEQAITYADQARSLAERIKYPRGLAYAYKSRGMGYYFQGDYREALNDWELSLNKFREINYLLGVSNMLNNLGAVYYNYGDNNTGIKYYLESLKVSEEIGDSLRIATALVNIGAVYYSKESTHDLALEYYSKALPMSEALGDYDAIGTSAVNMGQIYLDKKDADRAHFYFTKALNAYQKSENGNVAYAMLSLGRVYALRKEYEVAVDYQKRAYGLAESNNARLEMAQAMLSLGDTYDGMGDVQRSIDSYRRAQELSEEIGASYVLKDSYFGLATAYAKVPDYANAYQYQLFYNEIKDTLYNAELDQKIEDFTLIYEIEKQ